MTNRSEAISLAVRPGNSSVSTVADNAANAGILTGGRPVKPNEVDLRWVSALLYRNGVIEKSGVAAAVLNHPAMGVAGDTFHADYGPLGSIAFRFV